MFSGTLSRTMIESFVDILQASGLKQLEDKKWGLNKWHSGSTFGVSGVRNKDFKTIVDFLVPSFKQGISLAGLRPTEMTGYMESYVNTYLAHHVMRCLLTAPTENMPALQTNGLEKDVCKFPLLPHYDAKAIAAFQTRWTTLPSGLKLSIGTLEEGEKLLLSAKLAERIMRVTTMIDIEEIIRALLKEYLAQNNLEEKATHGLFAAAGASTLEAGRAEYTPEEQERDMKTAIKTDLMTPSAFK